MTAGQGEGLAAPDADSRRSTRATDADVSAGLTVGAKALDTSAE
jgi:hypothetical protein